MNNGQTWQKFISNVGIPAAFAFILLYMMFTVISENTRAINDTGRAIDQNTEVLHSLQDKIDQRQSIGLKEL